MFDLTPGERRGARMIALLLALGAAWDLWRAAHPALTPPPELADATPAVAAAAGGGPPAGAPQASGKLDLNRATAAQLDALPGIGPVLAGRIVQARDARGPFRNVEELLSVPGIGPRLFERLAPLVRVDSARALNRAERTIVGPMPMQIPVQSRGTPSR